ncbi:hypothetical protein JMJ77_0001565 [Colletotrichum scovillei]|uniref:Uncharacterized protein n=2 Tax=Colletotrichum acutatum species complex TaxID=2707335 RepID=A0A9P7R663_9PEZI|nr:hypothetical protein JMJ77_0001565 [Colletotrichum scovillei]KAG7069974.1 hypothetical protein JMJ76_0001233 [Colletotrichum scovillei]KXH61045.1 hypothetical protein CNYM01_11548 [Colletotrichum nymphaeae SA-01]
MKFTLATLLTIVAAVSAASVDIGLIARQDNCASKGGKSPLTLTPNCGDVGDRACCSGTTCQTTRAPVGGVGMICT